MVIAGPVPTVIQAAAAGSLKLRAPAGGRLVRQAPALAGLSGLYPAVQV